MTSEKASAFARKAADKHVEEVKAFVRTIIDAGNWAPTGLNQQCWRFVVVEEDAFRRKLAAAALPTWQKACDSWIGSQNDQIRAYLTDLFSRCLGWPPQPYEEMLRRGRDLAEGMYWGAPVIIFCIGTAAHAAQECAMVCQNMMLAATALGLGSCCVGFGARVTGDEEIVDLLALAPTGRAQLLPAHALGAAPDHDQVVPLVVFAGGLNLLGTGKLSYRLFAILVHRRDRNLAHKDAAT